MTDIQSKIIEYSTKHGAAIEKGDHRTANKLHSKLMSLFNVIKQDEKWDDLMAITLESNDSVRLWVATFLLNYDKDVALRLLNELTKSPKIIGLTASTTIDMWNKGMLQF